MNQPSSVVVSHDTAGATWLPRLRAAFVHLGLSMLVVGAVAILVFAVWYPYPYREVSSGRDLFRIVVCVDVVLGPLLTLAVFNIRKPRAELRRDLAVVALLQLSGLAYGLWTVSQARPVHMVFEIDRFRVVHRADVPTELEARAPAGIPVAPIGAPTPISMRPFRDQNEKLELTLAALQGLQLGARPDLWEPYAQGRDRILQAAKPAAELIKRFPRGQGLIEDAARRAGRSPAELVYLPMIARKADGWTVLLDQRTAEIVDYLPLDSF